MSLQSFESFIIVKSRLNFQHEYIHFLIAAASRPAAQAAQQLVRNATKTQWPALEIRIGA